MRWTSLTLGLIMGTRPKQFSSSRDHSHRPVPCFCSQPQQQPAATEAGADAAVDVAYATSSGRARGAPAFGRNSRRLSQALRSPRTWSPSVAAATTRGWLSTDESPLLVTTHLVHVVVGIGILDSCGHWRWRRHLRTSRCIGSSGVSGASSNGRPSLHTSRSASPRGIDYQVYFVVAFLRHCPQIAAASAGSTCSLCSAPSKILTSAATRRSCSSSSTRTGACAPGVLWTLCSRNKQLEQSPPCRLRCHAAGAQPSQRELKSNSSTSSPSTAGTDCAGDSPRVSAC